MIPVRNEASGIRDCIESIVSQSVPVHEIVVLDSGSTDGTLEILASYPSVRVVHLPPAEFDHGETRNAGVREATGELVLFTVGDACAAGSTWIASLLQGFVRDDVVAVCGLQIVPAVKTANPMDWHRPLSAPAMKVFQFKDRTEFDALSPADKLHACSWDNVTALYRRNVLQGIPFRRATYGEDALWAKDALLAGHALAYNEAAQVCHFHDESPEFTFRRSVLAYCTRYRAFGYRYGPIRVSTAIGRIARRILSERTLNPVERLRWIRYNVKNVLAQRSALRAFDRALADGDAAIDALWSQYSDRPPIPAKAPPASAGIAQ